MKTEDVLTILAALGHAEEHILNWREQLPKATVVGNDWPRLERDFNAATKLLRAEMIANQRREGSRSIRTLYKKIDRKTEKKFLKLPFDPNPYRSAQAADAIYVKLCKKYGVKPWKKGEPMPMPDDENEIPLGNLTDVLLGRDCRYASAILGEKRTARAVKRAVSAAKRPKKKSAAALVREKKMQMRRDDNALSDAEFLKKYGHERATPGRTRY
jgi:hypothetical protein